jgi:hypothetical protein
MSPSPSSHSYGTSQRIDHSRSTGRDGRFRPFIQVDTVAGRGLGRVEQLAHRGQELPLARGQELRAAHGFAIQISQRPQPRHCRWSWVCIISSAHSEQAT